MRPFRYLLRVRYHECDGQKIVFNARYGEYIDVATLEYCRTLFGSVEPASGGIDWRLVQQNTTWKAPANFDEVLAVEVTSKALGTTSFTLLCRVLRTAVVADSASQAGGAGAEAQREREELLASAETTYVVFDEVSGGKAPIPEHLRGKLQAGAPGVVVDCSGTVRDFIES
jgi:acyl-CoA thioester hydrolase